MILNMLNSITWAKCRKIIVTSFKAQFLKIYEAGKGQEIGLNYYWRPKLIMAWLQVNI